MCIHGAEFGGAAGEGCRYGRDVQGCTRDLEGGGDGGGWRQNPSAEGGELKRFFNYDAGCY